MKRRYEVVVYSTVVYYNLDTFFTTALFSKFCTGVPSMIRATNRFTACFPNSPWRRKPSTTSQQVGAIT